MLHNTCPLSFDLTPILSPFAPHLPPTALSPAAPSPCQLLARRRGLDLTQYGAVDEAAAKRLRLGGAADGAARAPLPDGVQEQLDDFENFTDECAPGQGGHWSLRGRPLLLH